MFLHEIFSDLQYLYLDTESEYIYYSTYKNDVFIDKLRKNIQNFQLYFKKWNFVKIYTILGFVLKCRYNYNSMNIASKNIKQFKWEFL